jgi:hypothetical protein
MKKIFLFFASGLLLSYAARAQQVITSATAYVPGDAFVLQPCNTTEEMPSAAGANVNVDYATLTPSGEAMTQQFVLPSATPDGSGFPEATVAGSAVSMQGNSGYSYFKVSGTQLELLGATSENFLISYTDPQLALKYPTAFNDTYSDAFSGNFPVTGAELHRSGLSQMTADAYGSITTPSGTFPYLRIKIVQEIIDSIYMAGEFIQVSRQDIITYNYMNNAHKMPLFSFSEIMTDMGNVTSAYYYNVGATGIRETATLTGNEQIHPNPARGELTATFDLKAAEQVSIRVYDITGKLMLSPARHILGQGTHAIPVDIASLAPGMYTLNITAPSGNSRPLKFIVN